MNYLLVIIFTFFFTSISVLGQGEANNWYFGQNAGISFNTTPPTILTDGKLNTLEGCTSISDTAGNLLFYTDGITIWDKSHNIMPNGIGLKGDPSSTSSALIVPQPNTPNIYIVFTVDEPHHFNADDISNTVDGDGINNGFMYSVIDMSLNGGNGDVISGQKNIQLVTYDASDPMQTAFKCSEKITAVKSEDCNNFWVITHFFDTFYAFKISQTGVNTAPIKSKIGTPVPISGYRRNALGYIKASPEGNKIVVAHFGYATILGGESPGRTLLYDFDNSTGVISNEIEVSNSDSPYGIEFSQSGQRLYVTFGAGSIGNGQSFIKQYNLSLPDSQIASSGTKIKNENNIDSFDFSSGALQLAPNGKIYRAQGKVLIPGNYLGVIENPEELAPNINYIEKGLNINIDGLRGTRLGLPPFIQSIFSKNIDIINNGDPNNVNLSLCQGDTYRLHYQDIPGATYIWYTNGTQIANTANFLDISTSGNYRLELDKNDGNCPLIGVANATFYKIPIATPSTIIQCDAYQNTTDNITLFDLNQGNDRLTMNNTNFSTSFFKDLADAQAGTPKISNPDYFINDRNNQVLYARVFNSKNPNCFDITTVTLNVSSTAINDAKLSGCDDDGIEDGYTTFSLTEANEQVISGITTANLQLSYYTTLDDALLNRNQIKDYTNITQYSKGEDIIYAKATSNDGDCFGISKVALFLEELPNIETETEYTMCQGQTSIEIDAGLLSNTNTRDFAFLWSTNETEETIFASDSGVYTVKVTNTTTGCSKTRTVTIIPSSVAFIESIDIKDARDNNTATVNVSGLGNYEYAIETKGDISEYQDDPTLTNIPPGFHTVHIRDKNGCLPIISKDISIIGFPKYFTPNGDGFHDSWNALGVSSEIASNSLLFIFDRYGKLLSQLNASSSGWDGMYNGNQMPSSQYWFRIELEDGRVVTGSFSLIR